MSCWRYTPTPKQDRFQDLLKAICPDFLHTNLNQIKYLSLLFQHTSTVECRSCVVYAQDNILCQFGLINLSSVHQLISQPILVHFWCELYHESISCTHKGKLDVICKHRDGSTARQTWEVEIVPQLNHDLFSFTKAMKEGWLMNGRWKEGGLMIELFKQAKTSMKFDRMIPSGSSWLMGIKTQRLVGQVHTAIEPRKSVPIWKFHQMTGHTGDYLMKTTADYMGIKLTGKLDPCEACA